MYTVQQLKAFLVVNGMSIPLSSVSCTYSINSIPTCQVTVPLGFGYPSGLPSPGYSIRNHNFRIYAEVVVEASGVGAAPLNGSDAIFVGFIESVSWVLNIGQAAVLIKLVHWLDALNYGSMYSRLTHTQGLSGLLTSGLANNNMGLYMGQGFLSPANAIGTYLMAAMLSKPHPDLWADGLYHLFMYLAANDHSAWMALDMGPAAISLLNPGRNDTQFDDAAAAVQAILTGPLTIDSNDYGLLAAITEDLIASDSTLWAPQAIVEHTFWTQLLTIGGRYAFAIAPKVRHAKLFPYIPGDVYWYKVIPFREIMGITLVKSMPRPTRSAVVLVDGPSMSIFLGDEETAMPIGGGAFTGLPYGIVKVYRAPQFFNKFELLYMSTFLRGNSAAGRRAAGRPVGGSNDAAFIQSYTASVQMRKSTIDKLARLLYNREILSGREAVIETAFRLDICPGSTIAIEYTGDMLYGRVVTVELNVSVGKAGTKLVLAEMRNAFENSTDTYSGYEHPIFTSSWAGGSLYRDPWDV